MKIMNNNNNKNNNNLFLILNNIPENKACINFIINIRSKKY